MIFYKIGECVQVVQEFPREAGVYIKKSYTQKFGGKRLIIRQTRIVGKCTCGAKDGIDHPVSCPVSRAVRHPQRLVFEGFTEEVSAEYFDYADDERVSISPSIA